MGKTTSSVKALFFSVDYNPDNNMAFVDAMEQIYQRYPNAQDRNWSKYNDNDFYRIEGFRKTSDGCTGRFIKLFVDKNLKIGKINSEGSKDLNLQPDERLQQDLHFIYLDATRTIVTHANKDVGNILNLAYYLNNLSDSKNFWMNIRLNSDAINKMKGMKVITRMELGLVAGSPTLEQNPHHSVKAVTDLSQLYGGLEIEIIIKQGRGKGSKPLNIDTVKQTMSEFNEIYGFRATKASVTGKKEIDDRLVPINLIKDKMQQEISVESENDVILPTQYYRALFEAYEIRKKELFDSTEDRMYGKR
jgi:hypothetical protein